MPPKNRADLKAVFSSGDIPAESDYANLFDSFINELDDGMSIDATTKNVGIGTIAPQSRLHLRGNSDSDKNVMLFIEPRQSQTWDGASNAKLQLGDTTHFVGANPASGLQISTGSTIELNGPQAPADQYSTLLTINGHATLKPAGIPLWNLQLGSNVRLKLGTEDFGLGSGMYGPTANQQATVLWSQNAEGSGILFSSTPSSPTRFDNMSHHLFIAGDTGNISINHLKPLVNLDINGSILTRDNPIYLRVPMGNGKLDQNHGLRWEKAYDGPRLWGYRGGALGYTNGQPSPDDPEVTAVLVWDSSNTVTITNTLKIGNTTLTEDDLIAIKQNAGR